MQFPVKDTIRGAIVLDNLPDRANFRTIQELLEALPRYMAVEVPQELRGVIASSDQPSDDETDSLWMRRDISGGVKGLYAFQDGKWHALFTFPEGVTQVSWFFGDSTNPPEGYVLITDQDGILPQSVVNALKAQYVPNPSSSGNYIYFAARFQGY